MIKGVSRYAVEVTVHDSPFFERVICFVRPQYADSSGLDLHREAARMAARLDDGVEEGLQGKHAVLRRSDAPPWKSVQNATDTRSETRRRHSPDARAGGTLRWLPLLLSAGGGAAAAFLLSTVF